MNLEPFDTADIVLHRPSGETWLLAYADGTHVYPCGWPDSRAGVGDCVLVKKATPDVRLYWLKRIASCSGTDHRALHARSMLAALEATDEP